MHPYVADRLAQARHHDLVAQAQAESVARQVRRAKRVEARRAGAAVRSWRVALGHRLVAFGVRLGVPPARRLSARRQAEALFTTDSADYRVATPC